jgi:hypothetical protein
VKSVHHSNRQERIIAQFVMHVFREWITIAHGLEIALESITISTFGYFCFMLSLVVST